MMWWLEKRLMLGACILCSGGIAAQSVSPAASRPWHSTDEGLLRHQLTRERQPGWSLDRDKTYSLAELIDLAELHNPETQAAWQRARVRAEEVGIARSAYYPVLVATVLAASIRQPALINEFFNRQTTAFYRPALHVEYLVFDSGGRAAKLDVAKANLMVQNLHFNDVHRQLIFRMASAYYRLLRAKGQRDAAVINLKNAETVEADTSSRMSNGLATRPDLLEATAARAQADYDLQATLGAEEIARCTLVTTMGLPAETAITVQNLFDLAVPETTTDSITEEIERAFQQRPELLADIARIRAAEGELKEARADYFPSVHFTGDGGLIRGYGQDDLLPGHYAEGETWSAAFELRWTLFDGAKREKRIAAARAQREAARDDLHASRDEIEQEVFTSYTNLQTALRQQRAATALLTSSEQSYTAIRQSFDLGLRSELDVVAAQKSLAQARYADVAARSQILLQVAEVAFRTADMIQLQNSGARTTP